MQHVTPVELSGDGLPDLAIAGNCPWDNGGSLMVLQQPSPASLAVRADSAVIPSLVQRHCGDGIPYWQQEECDTDGAGADTSASGRVIISRGAPRLKPVGGSDLQ
jgi:hypothetical protein